MGDEHPQKHGGVDCRYPCTETNPTLDLPKMPAKNTKYSPKLVVKHADFHPMGSNPKKNHLKKRIQATTINFLLFQNTQKTPENLHTGPLLRKAGSSPKTIQNHHGFQGGV